MVDKYYSKDDALEVLRKYCVYQDRCHSEVRTRLLKLKIYGDDLEDIIVDLIDDDFLNEERFAKAYVRGKYRMKSWGRYKIERALKEKRVSDYCIRKGMQEINEEEYLENLERLLRKRADVRPAGLTLTATHHNMVVIHLFIEDIGSSLYNVLWISTKHIS